MINYGLLQNNNNSSVMGCAFPTNQPQTTHNPNNTSNSRFSKRTHRVDCRKKSTQFVDAVSQNVNILDYELLPEQKTVAKEVLQQHYLFSQLSNQEIEAIVNEIIPAEALPNKHIFKQGDNGYCFFVIQEGQVQIEVDGKVHNQLTAKDSFGELALLYATSRTASAKSITKTKLFIIKAILLRKTLKEINTRNYQKIKTIISKVQAFKFLTNKQKSSLANIMVKVDFRKNEVIYTQKDPALSFYVVVEGSVTVEVPNKQGGLILGKYQSFGQSSFWEDGKRLGTVKANQNTVCMMIGKNQIMKCFGDSFVNVVYFNIQKWALRGCEISKQLSPQQIDKITSQFKIKYGKKNEIIFSKGNRPTGIIISLEGNINNKPTGTIFCHEFYKNEKVLEEDIVKNDEGVYSYLDFESLKQNIVKIINKRRRQSKNNTLESEKQNAMPFNMNSFQCIKKLGQGQFGTVYLVRDPTLGGNYYALKCLQKDSIRRQSMENCVISEKRILQSISFPYIVGFYKAYADRQHIYLLTQFINGIQMFDVIREIGLLNKSIARYFFASLLISVEYLHSGNIIYRDIKPQNSVVDSRGKVYLIDLGTAKVLKSQTLYRTFTIIGTPHYLAPEVMQGKGYTFDVDYWSLGVLLYQFLCGKLPYAEQLDDPYAIYSQVMRTQLKFPKFFNDEDAKNVISKLLQKNPSSRSNEGGFNAIKQSAYFSDFNWNDLERQKMISPYIPKKFRQGEQNLNKFQGTPFLTYLYKEKAKLKRANSNPNLNSTVLEWSEKFEE